MDKYILVHEMTIEDCIEEIRDLCTNNHKCTECPVAEFCQRHFCEPPYTWGDVNEK